MNPIESKIENITSLNTFLNFQAKNNLEVKNEPYNVYGFNEYWFINIYMEYNDLRFDTFNLKHKKFSTIFRLVSIIDEEKRKTLFEASHNSVNLIDNQEVSDVLDCIFKIIDLYFDFNSDKLCKIYPNEFEPIFSEQQKMILRVQNI